MAGHPDGGGRSELKSLRIQVQASALNVCRPVSVSAGKSNGFLLVGPEFHRYANSRPAVLGLVDAKMQMWPAGEAGIA